MDPVRQPEAAPHSAAAIHDAFGLVGTCIDDKVDVSAVIGEGGFGVVYRGHHRALARPVAIKCLKLPAHFSEAGRAVFLNKFYEEGRLLARLSTAHSAIVQVYDVGVVRGQGWEVPYLVLEWLDGESLEHRAKNRTFSEQEAVQLLMPAIDGIAEAHAMSVAHRDLKPENLYLTKSPRGERTRILDFGIAKVMQEGETRGEAVSRTTSGLTAFTASYGAPEQFLPKKFGATGPWTDVHALGLILVRLVTGRSPYDGTTALEIVSEATAVERPTPRRRGATVSDAFQAIVEQAIALSPEHRFADAAALARALRAQEEKLLQRLAFDESGAATRVSRTSVLGAAETGFSEPAAVAGTVPRAPPPSSKRMWIGLSVGALVLGGIGVFAVFGSTIATRLGSSLANEGPAQTTKSGSAHATGSANGRRAAEPKGTPKLGLAAIGKLTAASGLGESELDSIAYWESARVDFESAIALGDAPPRWKAAAKVSAAYAELNRGRPPAAEALLREAIIQDPKWAIPHSALAMALVRQRKAEPALRAARQAESLDPDWWPAICTLAQVHLLTDHPDDAVQELQRALKASHEEASVLAALAFAYYAKKLDDPALTYAKRALGKSPDLAAPRVLLAWLALQRNDPKGALDEAERAVASAPKSVAAEVARAQALLALRRFDDARAAYMHAAELGKDFGVSDPLRDLMKEVDADTQKRNVAPVKSSGPIHRPPGAGRPRQCPPDDPLCQ